MTITADGSRFSATEETLTPEQPRLHLGGVAALLLACLSAFSPMAIGWLLAGVAAVVLALISLWSIGRSGGLYYGRAVASVALCVALFFVALGISQRVYRERLLLMRSEELANDWIALLRHGNVEQAHQWTLPKSQRMNLAKPIDYADPIVASGFHTFQNQTGVQALRGATEAQVVLRSSRRSSVSKNFEQFTHSYRVTIPDKPDALELTITTERSRDFQGPWSWRIYSSTGAWRSSP